MDVELLRRWANSLEADRWTAGPGVVVAYDSATQTADVRLMVRAPLVNDEDEADIEHESLPIVPNVRVIFPSATGVGITFPISAGDEVLFIVSTLQLGDYRRTGQLADAVDVRRNHLGCGGWAIPCKFKSAATIDHAATSALVLEHSEIRIGKNATQAIAKEPPIVTNFNALISAITTAQCAAPGNPLVWTPPVLVSMAATKGKVE
jgi:hypothetical protein